MNPSSGRFISMDSYSGSIYDPMSLHKYLYGNGNPTVYNDPTGYYSLKETMTSVGIIGILARSTVCGVITSFGTTVATILQTEEENNIDYKDIATKAIDGFANGFTGWMFVECLFLEAVPALQYLGVQIGATTWGSRAIAGLAGLGNQFINRFNNKPNGRCAGYKIPLFLGGVDEKENLEDSDMDVYWEVITQMIKQL